MVTQALRLLPPGLSPLYPKASESSREPSADERTEDLDIRIKSEVAHVPSLCIPLARSDTWPHPTADKPRGCCFSMHPQKEENRIKQTCSTTCIQKMSFPSAYGWLRR